ncbi:MAG TPA: DUF1080 domain-containing protein [Planctomycetaceae bacterium]|nr:DUF1080 domain-containing protein [Planctomycetaceae bacterium]
MTSISFSQLIRKLGLCVLTLVIVRDGFAQESQPIVTLSEKEAGPDFAFQGEYRGKVLNGEGEEIELGLQVIAQGQGEFTAKAYVGGLPGAGWNKVEAHDAKGKREGEKVTLTSDHGAGVISDGKVVVVSSSGETLGTLNKVIRKSETLGAKPPEGAKVLFDGSSADQFKDGQIDDEGFLSQGTTSLATFQSFRLHLEFQLSFMPEARGQGRSNSGCYMQGRYEVQMLDSFGLSGEHNECGGIYSVKKPDVNMCFPPLSWQTYDVDFTTAKFGADGKKTANARMSVRHNGVLIHDNVEVDHATTASPLKEGPTPGPVYLQNHGNPVRYRNIWVVEK